MNIFTVGLLLITPATPVRSIEGTCPARTCIVSVRASDHALVPLFSDESKRTLLPNPFISSPNGTWKFWTYRGTNVSLSIKGIL